jgi:hypothetical protein
MQTALERCLELATTDPLAAAASPYLEHQIQEEMHHDEWLLNDLEFVGAPRSEVLRRMPSANAAAFCGARYYWVLHHHPVAELGALAVVECNPPCIEAVDLMQQLSGLPRRAFHSIEKHCHLDQRHRDELRALLDSLPLEEEHHELLGVCALHTVATASALYREIVEAADKVEEPACA